MQNAALARESARQLLSVFPGLAGEAIGRGFLAVRENTGLRGRLERLSRAPEIVADVAHNSAGVAALLDTWLSLRRSSSTHLLLGMLRSKDAGEVMRMLGKHSWKSVRLVPPASHDAMTLEELLGAARAAGLDAGGVADISTGFRELLSDTGEAESGLLFGSHYLVGPILADFFPKN
jgi:dihydrofolate synthase/folylpolyglutamate synthase